MSGQRIAITGSSGLIGGALSAFLRQRGDIVVPIQRSTDVRSGSLPLVPHDAAARERLAQGLASCDAVVNLAGASISNLPWTREYRDELRRSRIETTNEIVTALGAGGSAAHLVSGSAHGIYADCHEEPVTENTPAGKGFLADLCRDWEDAALAASETSHGVALLRTSLVLAVEGGALGPIRRLTKLGLMGPIGPGHQWWSWISLYDEVRAIAHIIDHRLSGPVNLSAPRAIRQREFAAALGRSARRPALLPAPSIPLRLVLGPFAHELLDSRRLRPTRLQESGFEWRQSNLDQVLDQALAR